MKQKSIFTYSIRTKKKRMIRKRIRFAILIVLLCLIGGYLFTKNTIGAEGKKENEIFPEQGIVMEEAIVKDFFQRQSNENLEKLSPEIVTYLKRYKGRYGLYYYNLKTGDEFGISEEDIYTAASTIKIPLNLCIFNKIHTGLLDLEDTITYRQEDYEEGTGILRNEKFGSKYSIRELSRLSITISDNAATNMLIRHLGKPALKEYMRQVGGKIIDEEQNISSPKDMGLYMKLTYEFYQNEGALGAELMESYFNTEFNDRLPALLPKTVKVAHKIGTQINVINEG